MILNDIIFNIISLDKTFTTLVSQILIFIEKEV